MYSKGLVYTHELTPGGIETVSDELFDQLIKALEQSGNEPRPLEERYTRYYQLDEAQRKDLLNYCLELDFWHEDLDFLLFEMDTSVRYFHQDRLDLKRLAVIYHTDNFYFRIHAYREKVFQLVSVFLGLGIPDRDPKFNDKVLNEIDRKGLGGLRRLLSDLCSDPALSEATGRRNPLAHRLAKRDWAILRSDERLHEYVYGSSDSEKIDKVTDLERYHVIKLDEFGRICERLAKFRDELVVALMASCT